MGNCIRETFFFHEVRRYDEHRRKDWDDIFRFIGLTHSEVCNLFDVYSDLDVDGSGAIDSEEFLNHFGLDQTRRFAKRLFEFMDDDKSGELDFLEFVVATWNYATLTKEDMPLFIFDLYDEDASNSLDLEEISDILRDLMSVAEEGRSKAELRQVKKNNEAHLKTSLDMVRDYLGAERAVTSLTRDEFFGLANDNSHLLQPATVLQQALRQKVVGLKFWREQIDHRNKHDDGSKLGKLRDLSGKVAAKAKKAEKDKDQYVRLGARRCVSNDGGTSGSGGLTTAK